MNKSGEIDVETQMKYIDEKCQWIQMKTRKHIMTLLLNELQDSDQKDSIIINKDSDITINLNKLAEFSPKLILNIYNLVRKDIDRLSEVPM